MKTWKHCKFIGILAIIVFCFAFTACPGPQGQNGKDGIDGQNGHDGIDGKDGKDGLNSYLVIFDTSGGIPIFNFVAVKHGGKVTEPNTSIKNLVGYNNFIGWYSDENFTSVFDFDTPITDNITLYAKWGLSLDIGDIGPGGGIIFYRSEAGFTMMDDNSTAHYLEAAPDDMDTELSYFSPPLISGTWLCSMDIGSGRKNTTQILNATNFAAPAAKACDDYSHNGKTDWFLPSHDELTLLYNNRTYVGNLKISDVIDYVYWSSSVQVAMDTGMGILIYLCNNNLTLQSGDILWVRAIRAF